MPVSFDEENAIQASSKIPRKTGGIIGFLLNSGLVKTKSSAENFLMIVVLILIACIAYIVYLNYGFERSPRYDSNDPALEDQTL